MPFNLPELQIPCASPVSLRKDFTHANYLTDAGFDQNSAADVAVAFRTAIGDVASNVATHPGRGLLPGPARVLLAGAQYAVWTRDAAINVWYGAGLIDPDVARDTLFATLTGSSEAPRVGGQGWDAIVMAVAAWELHLCTGNVDSLRVLLPAVFDTLLRFDKEEFDADLGLYRCGALFQDGMAAYPARYANRDFSAALETWDPADPMLKCPSGDGLPCCALSTNCLFYRALQLVPLMQAALGNPVDATLLDRAAALKAAINRHFYDPTTESYRYLVDPQGGCDATEGFGIAFVALFDIAPTPEIGRRCLETVFRSPHGVSCLWPPFERYAIAPGACGRHAGLIWPQVSAAFAVACARAGLPRLLHSELLLLAKRAVRDGHFAEIYHFTDGRIYGGVQEDGPLPDDPSKPLTREWVPCRRQTWAALGFVSMVVHGVLGLELETDGVRLAPAPLAELGPLRLTGLALRGRQFSVAVSGQGKLVHAVCNGVAINIANSQAFIPFSDLPAESIDVQLVCE
jgi:hypothetical protein